MDMFAQKLLQVWSENKLIIKRNKIINSGYFSVMA